MITPDLVARIPLFAGLDDDARDAIAARAGDLELRGGEWLIQEGETASFFALLAGSLDVVKSLGGSEQTINRYVPGDYFGELPLLLGSGAVASLRARVPSRVLRLSPADFQALVVGQPALSAELLRTMARRVGHLQQLAVETPAATVRVIGDRWDPECYGMRDFLARNQVAFEWLDLADPAALPYLGPAGVDQPCPLVIFDDGTTLVAPSRRAVADRLGMPTAPAAADYDVAIVGGGPAGLAAAVYGASEGLRTLLLDREAPGGQAGTSSRIENYLGFPAGLSGDELSRRAWQQARRFGAELVVARSVTGIEPGATGRAVVLDGGERVGARTIVLATGVAWRRLAVPGMDRLVGRGVYYGASRTEAPAQRGKDVYLIGGGNSAGQAALYLATYARRVTLLVRGDGLAASMSQYLIDQLATKANVAVRPRAEVVGVRGEDHLEAIVVRDRASGGDETPATDALFVFIGADAETGWLPGAIARDRGGYILTGRDVREDPAAGWPLARDPYLLETSVPGVFAAGDVRHGSIKRVASGVGEGSMSIAFIHQYLAAEGAD